jgi:hypothetical protein
LVKKITTGSRKINSWEKKLSLLLRYKCRYETTSEQYHKWGILHYQIIEKNALVVDTIVQIKNQNNSQGILKRKNVKIAYYNDNNLKLTSQKSDLFAIAK